MDFTSLLWAAIRQRLQAPEANELQVVDLSTGTSHSHRQLLQRVSATHALLCLRGLRSLMGI